MPSCTAVRGPGGSQGGRDRAGGGGGGGAGGKEVVLISHETVVPELEQASSGEVFDPVRDVEAHVCRIKVPRSDDALGVVGARGDPLARSPRVLARERPEQRQPVEVALGLLARRPLFAPGVNGLGDLVLLAERARRPSPAIVEHDGVGEARADLPVPGTDAEALRALIGTYVRAQPDAAHLATIPAPTRRDGVEPAIKMEISHEQAFPPP